MMTTANHAPRPSCPLSLSLCTSNRASKPKQRNSSFHVADEHRRVLPRLFGYEERGKRGPAVLSRTNTPCGQHYVSCCTVFCHQRGAAAGSWEGEESGGMVTGVDRRLFCLKWHALWPRKVGSARE